MVEVFQTSLNNQKDANRIIKHLQALFPEYLINFDLEDCDNILRVESSTGYIKVEPIMECVQNKGHEIAVLLDIVPKK